VTALDYDSRHTIAANVDYRYNSGEGPMIAGRKVFERAGVDFIAKARSGEPYTRYTDAQGNTVIGGVAGSRKAWHYGVDMRIDKDFALRNMKKLADAPAGIKPKRPLFLKAIFQVNNLLNTRDVTPAVLMIMVTLLHLMVTSLFLSRLALSLIPTCTELVIMTLVTTTMHVL
jgi:hypothetical protein